MKSIRTNGLDGQVILLPGDNICLARIDAPHVFAKKSCVETWSLVSGTREGQFCDPGRNASVALAASAGSGRVVGFAFQIHKDLEGHAYPGRGRVDVWDMRSGALIAPSAETADFVTYLQISASGEWVMAGQRLCQIITIP